MYGWEKKSKNCITEKVLIFGTYRFNYGYPKVLEFKNIKVCTKHISRHIIQFREHLFGVQKVLFLGVEVQEKV